MAERSQHRVSEGPGGPQRTSGDGAWAAPSALQTGKAHRLKTSATWDTQVENLCYEGHRYGSTSVAVPWRMTRPAASSTTQVAARFAKPWSCVTTTMV